MAEVMINVINRCCNTELSIAIEKQDLDGWINVFGIKGGSKYSHLINLFDVSKGEVVVNNIDEGAYIVVVNNRRGTRVNLFDITSV